MKKAKAPASHPKYIEMITTAISGLKERTGCSRQAILKYIVANNKVEADKAAIQVRLSLKAGLAKGVLKHAKENGKGAGKYKIVKVEAKKEEKKPSVKKVAKKPTAEKPTAKKPKAEKPDAKKSPAKKAAPKKKASPKKKSPAKKTSPEKKVGPKKTASPKKKPVPKKTAAKKAVKK